MKGRKQRSTLSETDPALSRLAQQERWRQRLANAESEYQHASEELRQAQIRNTQGANEPEVTKARERKAAARIEYLRVMRVFTDLVLRGKSPSNGE